MTTGRIPSDDPLAQPRETEGRTMTQETEDSNTTSEETSGRVYRGFSSSISHLFSDSKNMRTDACALACCGVLQSDRDRYLLTGVTPPSLSRRFLLHVVVPFLMFSFACFCAMRIRSVYMNQLLSTLLIAMLVVYVGVQACCKSRWKRVMVRKELLWRRYQTRNPNVNMAPPEEDDDKLPDTLVYLQGQSINDLHCAHAFTGCYPTDIGKHADQPPPAHFLDRLVRILTGACCGRCGCFWQCCGMCALAQEARELEQLVPSNQRRIDYVTMQPSLNYYHQILKQRAQQDSSVSLAVLSRLSAKLLQLWVLVLCVLIVMAAILRFHIGHILIFIMTFAHAFVFTWLVHWPYHKHDVSVDAVIKAFSAGFFMCTSMAVMWELVMGFVIRIFVDVILALSGTQIAVDDGYEYPFLPGGFAQSSVRKEYLAAYGREHPFFYSIYLLISAFVLAALIEEIVKYLGYQMVSDHPDLWSENELECVVSTVLEDVQQQQQQEQQKQQQLQQEEEQKQQDRDVAEKATRVSVEGLPTHTQRKSAQTTGAITTVMMVSVALGYSCCENLVYIFIYNENSLVVEIIVLVVRTMFPIHPICAALQSIGVVRRNVEKDTSFQLGQILLPAIMIHGFFDYVLMMTGFFASGSSALLTAVLFGVVLVILSSAWYFYEAKNQRERLKTMDQQSTVDQSTLL